MHCIATTALSLWAVLSSVPLLTATPVATASSSTSSIEATATSTAGGATGSPTPTTFNDGHGDIPSDKFSMVMSAESANYGADVYTFVISTFDGSTSPAFSGGGNNWQTLSSPYLPDGLTVDVTTGSNWGSYQGNADGLTIKYANQHFNVEADHRCQHWLNSGAGTATSYFRCLCPLKPS